jgi:hypothetical protein
MKRAVIFLMVLCFCCVGCYEYSKGSKSGELIKISKKGWMFKSWEGEIITTTFRDAKQPGQSRSSGGGNAFFFSIDTNKQGEELAKILENSMGRHVQIDYIEERFTAPFRADTNYFVTGVKILN